MNKNIINKILLLAIGSTLMLYSCSDMFLQEKQDYNKTTEFVYDNFHGAQARVDNLYALMLPSATAGVSWEFPSAGSADEQSKNTEEYGGFTDFIDPNVILTNTNVPGYFHNELKTSRNPFGRIRNCNDVIQGVTDSKLSDTEKELLLGQAYFFRAWMNLRLVRFYGGIPLIKERQDVIIGDDEGLSLAVPRSSAKECIEFICDDLQLASEYLPARWSESDFGRITSGAALALQGRAKLLYASPVFNRVDDKNRREEAYQSNKAALAKLEEGRFGLAYKDAPGINASGWGKMFSDTYGNPEAVFVTLYNNVKQSGSTNLNKNNEWEQGIRPSNAYGSGGKTPTATIVDLFPMADGKRPNKSDIDYDRNAFMLNRDPRFYRTFGFTGSRWTFTGDPTSLNATQYPYKGENYALWNYAWYSNANDLEKTNTSGYGADGLATNYKGIYVRKRSDDYDLNSSSLYNYDVNTSKPFGVNAASYMEIRFAEVLLNFAEAACGAHHGSEAVNALKQIRERVGYTAENNFGLDADLEGNRAKLFEAILYERQIELAYEGKRYDDMHRWMLWDGGTQKVDGQPTTWNLTGFNGNTCNYLGVEPLNGKIREGLELRVANSVPGYIGDAKPDADPLKSQRPAAWNLKTEAQPSVELQEFYNTKLARKKKDVDPSDRVIQYKSHCYFLGLRTNAQSNNTTLEQTIGWDDLIRGGMGTFDPLVE